MKTAYVKPSVMEIKCDIDDPIMSSSDLIIPSWDIGEDDDLE